jgi:hypothetical protein
MGYRLLGMVVWNGLKWVLRRRVRGTSVDNRAKLAGGLAVVVAIFLFVLSRKGGDEG